MTRISFIWHDCFVVEMPAANIVFDYWLDSTGSDNAFPKFLENLDHEKPLFVLVSHGHKDHFNKAVFEWSSDFPKIHYIVSGDVGKRIRHILSPTSVYNGTKISPDSVTVLRRGESLSLHDVRIHAFPSTDIGNSYMVEACGHRIFHAGDLNAWLWLDDSTDTEIKKALGDYKACLREIRNYIDSAGALEACGSRKIDFCFFPVDSRIGREYFTGARMFVREFDVCHFFPMHFDLGDESERSLRRNDALKFNEYANFERGDYIPLVVNGTSYVTAG